MIRVTNDEPGGTGWGRKGRWKSRRRNEIARNSLVFRASIHPVEILQRFRQFHRAEPRRGRVVSNSRSRLFSSELPLPLGNFEARSERSELKVRNALRESRRGILKARRRSGTARECFIQFLIGRPDGTSATFVDVVAASEMKMAAAHKVRGAWESNRNSSRGTVLIGCRVACTASRFTDL